MVVAVFATIFRGGVPRETPLITRTRLPTSAPGVIRRVGDVLAPGVRYGCGVGGVRRVGAVPDHQAVARLHDAVWVGSDADGSGAGIHEVTVALKNGVALSGLPMIEMMRPTGVNEGLLDGGLPFR